MKFYYVGKKSRYELYKSIDKLTIPEIMGNALLFGDNLKAMYGLLDQFRGKIDLVYIDPPFNTSKTFYFKEDKVRTLSTTKECEVAYDDRFSKEQYIEFIRERLLLIHDLLSPRGSLYIHIDCKVGHYVKIIADEIFGDDNFRNDIARIKCDSKNFKRKAYGNVRDMLLFYTKDNKQNIWNDILVRISDDEIERRFMKIDADGRRYNTMSLNAPGETKNGVTGMEWRGRLPPKGRHWRSDPKELDKLDADGRIEWSSTGNPRIKMYADEYKGDKIQDVWTFKDPHHPIYPTEKNSDMLDQIILQSSLPDSIVLDCFAGSGTTLKSAERNGRRWIGIDQSDVAIRIIKQNMKTDYTYIEVGR